jgi:carbonic anhydrase
MTVYRRRPTNTVVPIRGLMALAVLALMSTAFAAEPPAPLPKADPIQITPIAPAVAQPAAAPQAGVPSKMAPPAAGSAAAPNRSSPSVSINGVSATKISQQQPAAPTPPADPNEAVRQALRERMAGSGELVIRSTDSIPPPAQRPAAPAPKAAPRPVSTRPVAVAPWDYDGERGPQSWAKLHPSYALCEKGRFQSPIDLRDGVGVDLPPISFEFKPSLFKVTDTGKTLELSYNNGGSFTVLGNVYRLSHIEFRHPAEERINGRTHGMSLQMHFRDAQGRMAAVSVLLNPTGKENPFIQTVWNHIPLLRNEPISPPDVLLDLGRVLPRDLAYYTYMGSLTSPPCTEGVTWYVLKNPVDISSEQAQIFGRLYPSNVRPIQAGNSRLIKESRARPPAPAATAPAFGGLVAQ